MARTSDVIIVGAGLQGLSCALYLAQAGRRVAIVEKSTVGRHASSANAGGVRQLGRAVPEIPLACAAVSCWHNMRELVGDDCGFVNAGQIKVAETDDQLLTLKARSRKTVALGYNHEEIIGPQELYELLPALAPDCVGGMIVRSDGHANPFRTVQAFRRKVVSLGVQIHENTPANGARYRAGIWQISAPHADFEAPVVINAAGAWGGEIAAMLGDRVPIIATALMLMITERLAPFIKPVVGAAGRPLSFKQFENGTVLLGGAYHGHAEPEQGTTDLDITGLANNAAAAAALFPAMRRANILRCWAGIEGVLPDHLPVIGAGSQGGVFHATGFSAHGFALAPITGKIITDLIEHGVSDIPVKDLSVNRFSSNGGVP